MADKTSAVGDLNAGDTGITVRDVAQRARKAAQSMTDVARDAATTIDESRSTAAAGLDSAASTLRDRADELPGGETARGVARATADRLSTGAEYMRTHDATRMMADIESIVKRNPGPAIAIAATFGFLLGRALSRD
jgi:ElaB/YqjD/DUF883 family membrane-anchored ribosome-binding protein